MKHSFNSPSAMREAYLKRRIIHAAKGLGVLVLMAMLTAPCATSAADASLQDSDTLYHDISYDEELEEAERVLCLGDIAGGASNLVLPHSYGIHVNISWESSNEEVIDLQGNVSASLDQDCDIVLTAHLSSTKTSKTKTKEFSVHVPRASVQEILDRDAKTAQEYIDYIVNDGYVLPDAETLGIRSSITWELADGEAALSGGKVAKTRASAERQPIALRAVLEFEGQEKTAEIKNLVLLDTYQAYILSYFAGKNESKEMYLGYSYDGVHWMRLNSADAVLTPKKGLKQIRDPFIMRKKDGSFAVFATNGWTSPMITIWDSENLETFENERLCKLSEKDGVASGFHTWAPECNYDPLKDLYYVYWSDPKANDGIGQIYYNTTSDLQNFSQAGVFFEREFFVIDASIKKYHGDYYMVYDDATGDNDTGNGGRRIYAAKADSLEPGTFYPYCGVLSEGVAEGPFLFQNFKDDSWFVYYDYYSKHKFGYASINDLTTDDWKYHGICETMPWEEVRHGGVIPVTEKELQKILAAWGKDAPEVSSINKTASLKTHAGEELSALQFPKSVRVTLSDGNVVDAAVTWDTKGLSLEKEGTFAVQGILDERDTAFVNEKGLQPEITITVARAAAGGIWYAGGAAAVIVLAAVAAILIKKKLKQN